ncbi:MAG: DUF6338 family protein [Myxococcales bacterium]|nr:DUF6338 family protein [Myxococcales bacterium]
MKLSAEALELLTVLMPGFLASLVFSHATVRKRELSYVDKIVEALLWTAAVAVMAPAVGAAASIGDGSGLGPGALVKLIVLVLVLPTALAAFVNHDLYLRFLNRFGLSRQRSSRPVWGDAFQLRAWVALEFADGRRLVGWPTYYPQAYDDGWLYLTQAAWVVDVDGQDKTTDVEGHGLLVRLDDEIRRITFFD